jgi:phytoene desaturase
MSAPRAAVVGSGFGGLAVAVRLQSAGFETTLFEARDRPGGRAYVYEQDGFIFDGGPTVITAPHVFEELFEEAGRSLGDYVDLMRVEPFYRLHWEDGVRFDYAGDTESMVAQIRARNPADVEGYLAFVEYASRVFQAGYAELASTPFLRFSDMVRVAPDLIRLRADRSVYATVSRFVEDEHVRQALSFHSLLVGGNPFETSSIYVLIHYLEREWGVLFPRGGTGALVQALVTLFQELGGEIRLSTPVERIDLDRTNGRATHRISTAPVEDEPFDLVVSNADLHYTYGRLFRSVPEAAPMRRRLERMEWSMSLFVLYFGTDRRYDETVAHHTILFGRRFRELLDDIFHGDRLPEDFSLYLHAPTVTDPSLAPPGCEAFYVLAPVPHLGNARIDWASAAEGYADRIFEYLERYLPDLRRHLITKRWLTPSDFESVLNSYHGSAFSCAPKLSQSAWFRPHNRDDRIPGLYLVGAGTHPGAGVPGVMNSAKATAGLVVEDFLN